MDACRDTTLIILMVAAAASLALGIKSEVSICVVVVEARFPTLSGRENCQSLRIYHTV